jgi:hypothetical protein
MPKQNIIPIENKKPFETVQELKNEVPSFEEFMKSYEADEKVSENYDLEVNNHGDIREPKKSGPMFNLAQIFQVLLNTPAGTVVDTVARGTGGGSPDIARTVMEVGRFASQHSNELTHVGRAVGEYLRDGASSSSSVLTTASSYVSDYRTLWDW